MEKKKVWIGGAIVAAVITIGGVIYAIVRKGHVDTESISEAVAETMSDVAEAATDFMEEK